MPKVRIDDSLEMYYEDNDFTDPWKTPQTAVLQHCNGGSSKMYYRWAPVIARHYRFIRANRRGQGGSTVPSPGYPWSLAGWVQEMDVFLDRLELNKAHIIGEATGSYVCLRYAYDHPERVSSLTLINCAPALADRRHLSEFGRLVDEKGVEGWVRDSMKTRFDPSQVDPEYIEWHAQEKIRQPQHVSAEVLKYNATIEVTDILPKINVPTLIIAGEGSTLHPQGPTQRLQQLIPNAKLATIPGVAGYVAHAAPESCAGAWLDFVRELG